MNEYEPLIDDQRLIRAIEPLVSRYPILQGSDFFTYIEPAHPQRRQSGVVAIVPEQAVFAISSPKPKDPEHSTMLQAKTPLRAFRAHETMRRTVVDEAFGRLARQQARRLADLRDLLPPTPDDELPS
jgi:hypothetical protein